MDLFEAIEKRCSVRDFKDIPIPKEDLEKILDAGRRAPSGHNTQPWEFILITSRKIINDLRKIVSFDGSAQAVIGIIVGCEKSPFLIEDGSAAIENMLLAVTGLEYGSYWIEGQLIPKENQVKKLLSIPDNLRLLALLPVGVPKSEGVQREKKPLSEIVHYEKYGNKK